MKSTILYIISFLLIFLFACSNDEQENITNQPTDEKQDFSLFGTWSYVEQLSDNQSAHYHLTLKEDSTAVFCLMVLNNDNPSNPYREWHKDGDIACFYDSVFYTYSYNGGDEIYLKETSHKIYKNKPWLDQCYYWTGFKSEFQQLIKNGVYNTIYGYVNERLITRLKIQDNNITLYTWRLKGVYRYDYDHNGYTADSWNSYGYNEVKWNANHTDYIICSDYKDAIKNGIGYDINGDKINTASAAVHRGENGTFPCAYDSNGNFCTDAKGNPLAMYLYNNNEGSYRYQFRGGDPIFEDENIDGQIDKFDAQKIAKLQKLGYDTLNIQYLLDSEMSPF